MFGLLGILRLANALLPVLAKTSSRRGFCSLSSISKVATASRVRRPLVGVGMHHELMGVRSTWNGAVHTLGLAGFSSHGCHIE